jgi:hypothetical protein
MTKFRVKIIELCQFISDDIVHKLFNDSSSIIFGVGCYSFIFSFLFYFFLFYVRTLFLHFFFFYYTIHVVIDWQIFEFRSILSFVEN